MNSISFIVLALSSMVVIYTAIIGFVLFIGHEVEEFQEEQDNIEQDQ